MLAVFGSLTTTQTTTSNGILLTCKGWRVKSYSRATTFLIEDPFSVPGCVVLDVHMPDLTGLELQQIMKEREIVLPIIFLTGYGDIDMAVNTMIDGADGFSSKAG